MTSWNLLSSTGALLAFLIGLMTLIGRERKSPYSINRVIFIFLICLFAGFFSAISGIFFTLNWNIASTIFLFLGAAFLLLGFILSLALTYNVFLRLHFLVDHITWKNLPIISDIRRKRKENGHKPSYEYNPLKFPTTVEAGLNEFMMVEGATVTTTTDLRTLCVRASNLQETNDALVSLSLLCLSNGVTVQYLTAARHPIGFVGSLKAAAESEKIEFSTITNKLVVIDAYSPHYAFLDSIYSKKTREVESLGVDVVKAKALYAGIHTAAAKAFNILKSRSKESRLPTLVIYENPYALVDLESPDQYRIFVRHVLPSERLWGGMFTVVVETAQPDGDWALLQAYADAVIDKTKTPQPGHKPLS